MNGDLVTALRSLATDLDRVLAGGLVRLHTASAWSTHELDRSLDDALKLSRHSDACYDRPSTGWAYAAWYHGRRVHDALRLLAPVVARRTGTLAVVDLGAGTGATLWALTALVAAAARASVPLPRLHVVAVDASEPMVTAAEALWDHLRRSQPFADAALAVDARFELASWTDLPSLALPAADARWLVGGYLFDESDRRRGRALGELLVDGAIAAGAEEVHLVGSRGKTAIAERVGQVLDARGWARLPPEPGTGVWAGPLAAVAAHRRAAYRDVPRALGVPDTTWTWPHEVPTFLRFRDRGARDELFRPRRRDGVVLDDEQERAASPDGRLTAIVGAAGSGKSRVLVERVVRTVERRPRRDGPAKVVVTTFNVAMVDQLATWLDERLPSTTLRRWRHLDRDGIHTFSDPGEAEGSSILVLNWDKVPSRLLGVPAGASQLSRPAIDRALVRAGIDPATLGEPQRRVVSPELVEAELHRVMYGLRTWHDRSAYLAVDRRGRRTPLNAAQRELVWQAATGSGVRTWSHYRIDGLERARALHAAGRLPRYTDLFLDECQDMTPADFELASLLVVDPDRIVVAGDEAQSLHLGASYQRPGHVEIPSRARVAGGPAYRRWLVHRLAGSYRLPIRVCECVQPLARHLDRDRRRLGGDHDVGLPEARRPAVLGVRPIVLSAANAVEVLPAVLGAYRRTLDAVEPSCREITVAEGTFPLEPVRAAAPPGYRVGSASMLAIKGLERACVIWSTAGPIRSHECEVEWAYTIVTRTRCLAVIVVDPAATPDERAGVVRLLRADRLLCWDAAAEDALMAVRARARA